MNTQATIKLGDLELNVLQLEDGSYASPGLFRLLDTPIYQYQEAWYWLGAELPDLRAGAARDPDLGAFIDFEGNKLAHLYMTRIDPEKAFRSDNIECSYVPVPRYIESVIRFCALGELLPDEVIDRLRYMVDEYYHSSSVLTRRCAEAILLRDTLQDLRLSGETM
jgi:hypothetical protein